MIIADINSFCKLGIPSPVWIDWVMLTAYVVSAYTCFKASTYAKNLRVEKQSSYWKYLSSMVFILGVNKFLFLHGCAAYGIRYLAMQNGWYDLRKGPQMLFIFAVTIIFMGMLFCIYNLVKRQVRPIVYSVVIVTLLLLLVIIRIASLHQVDAILYSTFSLGVGLNAFLELLGTASIGVLAYLYIIKQVQSKNIQ